MSELLVGDCGQLMEIDFCLFGLEKCQIESCKALKSELDSQKLTIVSSCTSCMASIAEFQLVWCDLICSNSIGLGEVTLGD